MLYHCNFIGSLKHWMQLLKLSTEADKIWAASGPVNTFPPDVLRSGNWRKKLLAEHRLHPIRGYPCLGVLTAFTPLTLCSVHGVFNRFFFFSQQGWKTENLWPALHCMTAKSGNIQQLMQNFIQRKCFCTKNFFTYLAQPPHPSPRPSGSPIVELPVQIAYISRNRYMKSVLPG